jgi:AcrR family transcriptional regulator
MDTSIETTSQRPPGRPRDARADLAILESTLESFIDDGFRGMSMDGIAARAGVGKATIYRRWSSKEELLVDAISSLGDLFTPADTGSVKDDLVSTFFEVMKKTERSKSGRCMHRMLGEMRDNPALLNIYRQQVLEPRRRVVREILTRGIDRGELNPDIDIEVAIDMMVGPIVFRKMTGALTVDTAQEFITALVDQALRGLRTLQSSN